MNSGRRAQADRLTAALAELLAREAVAARRGSGLAVRAVQIRIAPLIDRLVQLAGAAPDAEWRAACAAIRSRQDDNRRLMEAALERLRADIAAKTANLRRLGRMAPAYGQRRGMASCLDVAR